MLPPQLRQPLVLAQRSSLATLALKTASTSILRTSLAHHQQRRSFFGWRRRSDDWASHLDPKYHRFCRFRTLKTRAKLLRDLRRRGKFNWDSDTRPFFTPQAVRWASHWDGKHRRQWWIDQEAKAVEEKNKNGQKVEEEPFELSPREKEWKEKMEAMRKRIERDPYEAIFGKRFQPFWSPLVPTWMREEMGLQGWPKQKDAEAQSKQTRPIKNEAAERARASELSSTLHANLAQQAETSKTVAARLEANREAEAKANPAQKPTALKPGLFHYASSISWDSRTNKTQRVEWDSTSGQTRNYEYDPISNRMVQIQAPEPVTSSATSATVTSSGSPKTSEPAAKIVKTSLKDALEAAKAKAESKSKAAEARGVSIPVKQSTGIRKAIPVPAASSLPAIPLASSQKTFAAMSLSLGPVKSTAIATETRKPASLAKVPEKKDVDSLTADQVRANMGRMRQPSAVASAAKPAQTSNNKSQIDMVINERHVSSMVQDAHKDTEFGRAEMNVMLDQELESLRKKKEKLLKDEKGLFHIERQKRELQKLDERILEVVGRVEKLSIAVACSGPTSAIASKTTLAKSSILQPSLDRMQSKDIAAVAEPDDSAAHEATEPAPVQTAVPKNWSQQADLLQADRVRRTTSKRPFASTVTRWLDDMQARKDAYEAEQATKNAAKAERQTKLEKANAMLEAEVAEQKARMQAHETRYAHKIRSLRGELETAYKQSTVHSETHLERIKYLEDELSKATKAVGEGASTNGSTKIKQEASDAQKKVEIEKAEQKARDRALVKEVREIYEKKYGVIDAAHRQPSSAVAHSSIDAAAPVQQPKQVVEVESDVDLGEALASYEKEATPYSFTKDSRIENELAAQELAYYENQGPLFKEKSQGAKNASIDLVGHTTPKPISTEPTNSALETSKSAKETTTKPQTHAVQWEEPPVYKILAYDSGNDKMSTATTTSNFTDTEAPISIPQALSQLYQPARFVPYFAELQRDGYQVIHGTSDLLVFKKVKEVKEVASAQTGPKAADAITVDELAQPSITTADSTSAQSEVDTERYNPSVRRMEQHFTGSRRRWNTNYHRHKRAGEHDRGYRQGKKQTLRWVLGGGLGVASAMYLVGAAAETARHRKEDDWAKRAEEQRRKWNS